MPLREGRTQSKIGGPSPCFLVRETAGADTDVVVLNLLCTQMLLETAGVENGGPQVHASLHAGQEGDG